MEIIFFTCGFLIVYSYVLYPLLLWVFGSLFLELEYKDELDLSKSEWPSIAVVIAAYNEEEHIHERFKNLQKIDYPKEKIHFYIGSDGSDDKTNEIMHGCSDKRLSFYPFEARRGKASVLNDLISKVEEDLIVLSDANTEFRHDALKLLADKFSQSDVGGVCGELQILSKENNENLDSVYWKYERYIKSIEGKFDAILGANGAIYAIRKNLFVDIPVDTITDDFFIGMQVIKQGYKFLYQPSAVAYEYEPDSHTNEFGRRVRIGMGNYQALVRLKSFLNPFLSPKHFFTYFSHKVLRWFTPHMMILMFVINLFLIKDPVFLVLFLMQVLIYAFCWYAYKNLSIRRLPVLFSLIVFFVSMNTALFIGFVKYLSQKANPAWQRTAR